MRSPASVRPPGSGGSPASSSRPEGGGERSGASAATGRRRPAAAPSGAPENAVAHNPPLGNTGGLLTWGYTGISGTAADWLTVVGPVGFLDDVRALVNGRLGLGEDLDRGMRGFNRMHAWESGGVLAWSDDGQHCMLSLNGASVELFSLPQLFAFVRELHAMGFHSTRIDLRYDDYSRALFPLHLVHAAADAGNFMGFKVHAAVIEKRRTGETVQDQHRFGASGKAGSGKMVVFYDKALESDGEKNCIRMEVRFFKEKAAAVFDALATAPDEAAFVAQMGEYLGGAIDFRDRQGKHMHRLRMKQLDWWERFVAIVKAAPVVIVRSKPPLQRTLEYLGRSYATSLALLSEIAESMGEDADAICQAFTRLMVDRGKGNLNNGYRPGARYLGLDLPALLGSI